jgi:hypothetical protein
MQARIAGLALGWVVGWASTGAVYAAGGSPPAVSPWTTYQGNALHTGYVPVTLTAAEFKRAWSKAVGTGEVLNPVTEADGMVYVTNQSYFQDAGLFVLSAKDGSMLWSTSFPDIYSVNPPAYDDGNVYLQTDNNGGDTWVWGYEASSGTLLFRSPADSQWERYYAPTIVDHTLYMDGGTYGGMYSFNGKTGAQNWFDTLNQYDQWTPAVDATFAYAYIGNQYGGDAGLNIVDRKSGTTVGLIADPNFGWNGYDMNVAPAVGSQGDALVYNAGRLVSFDLAGRTLRWQQSTGFNSQPAVAPGVVYAIQNGLLSVRDEATGAPLWSVGVGADTLSGPVVVTDSHVFVSGAAGTYAIDLGTHQLAWSDPATGLLAVSEGTLYIAGADGNLTAVSLGNAVSGGADLSLTLKSRFVSTGGSNGYFDFVAGTHNRGPENATSVRVDIRVPGSFGVNHLDPSCRYAGRTITCQLADLPSGGTWKPAFHLVPSKAGTFDVGGKVSATQSDAFSRNNHDVVKLTVQ